MNNKKIIIGSIQKPYGIFGWLHIISFTEIKKNIFNYFPWQFHTSKDIYQKKDILSWKKHIKDFIVLFKNIENRTKAYKIAKQKIIIPAKTLPILKKNEYYWNDILSCHVYDIYSQYLGVVFKIISNNFYDLLIIKTRKERKKKIIYIPFIMPNIIKKIDLIKKIIIAQWII